MVNERRKEIYRQLCELRAVYQKARDRNCTATCEQAISARREEAFAEFEYRRMMPHAMALLDELMDSAATLRAENERLREALEWYYEERYLKSTFSDGGGILPSGKAISISDRLHLWSKAKQALSEGGHEEQQPTKGEDGE